MISKLKKSDFWPKIGFLAELNLPPETDTKLTTYAVNFNHTKTIFKR